MRQRLLLLALFVLGAAVVHCGHLWIGRQEVEVTVALTPGTSIEQVEVIVGPEKTWWGDIEAGDTDSWVLDPDGEIPELDLSFVLAGKKRAWTGPRFPRGTGYRIRIEIDAKGTVSERHCFWPCWLR